MSTQTITQRRTASAAPAPVLKKPIVSQGGVTVNRVPSVKPTFTIGDIRRAIPAHCFSRPLTKSFSYLFWDLFLVGVIVYASTFIPLVTDEFFGATLGPILRGLLWVTYWICQWHNTQKLWISSGQIAQKNNILVLSYLFLLGQGCVCTGLWVIGHECGHRGFADSELINDVVGLVVHSFLLVPYFAWQISHRRHHSNTGSVEHDEVFVPPMATPEQIARMKKLQAGDLYDDDGFLATTYATIHRMFYIVVMLTLGWPAYLFMNITGNQSYNPHAWVNHFMPSSPIYTTGSEMDGFNQKLILISDVSLIAVCCVFYKFVQLTSFSYFMYMYFIPYLIVNFWLVLITYLQHTDLNLPHYTEGEWDWLRGALATVDRDYGFINIILHHITDTHVVHHLFSPMPHYHAQEATEAVKGLLGEYYRYDNTPIATALWNSFRDCTFLYPDDTQKGVHWFEPVPARPQQ